MAKSYFVTGTDTEVGKTLVTSALLHAYKKLGLTTAAIKPVAAGCVNVGGQWQNDDALQLIDAMTVEMPYEQVNPVALEAPIAPHIAANEEVIPELLQSKCNSKKIFETVDRLLGDKSNLEKQIIKSQEIISNFKTQRSSEIASSVLIHHLKT